MNVPAAAGAAEKNTGGAVIGDPPGEGFMGCPTLCAMPPDPATRTPELDALWSRIIQLTDFNRNGEPPVRRIERRTGIPRSTVSGWYKKSPLLTYEQWEKFVRYFDEKHRDELTALWNAARLGKPARSAASLVGSPTHPTAGSAAPIPRATTAMPADGDTTADPPRGLPSAGTATLPESSDRAGTDPPAELGCPEPTPAEAVRGPDPVAATRDLDKTQDAAAQATQRRGRIGALRLVLGGMAAGLIVAIAIAGTVVLAAGSTDRPSMASDDAPSRRCARVKDPLAPVFLHPGDTDAAKIKHAHDQVELLWLPREVKNGVEFEAVFYQPGPNTTGWMRTASLTAPSDCGDFG